MTKYHELDSEERLGRRVFSSGHVTNVKEGGRVRLYAFLEREGESRISMDRLGLAPPDKILAMAKRAAERRSTEIQKRTFYGWAVIAADRARMSGRMVQATPRADNEFHADIILPDSAINDRVKRKRHAQELADMSSWHGVFNS